MADFYRTRVEGTSRIAALQKAQIGLLRGTGPAASRSSTRGAAVVGAAGDDTPFVAPPGRPFAHPFYWAPFVLIGNWR